MRADLDFFPPAPRGLRGRASELRTLVATLEASEPGRLALVGAGGSGKSMLAAALGYRMKRRYQGRLHWFRVGAWDIFTLAQMMALRFGLGHAGRAANLAALRRFLGEKPRFVVLDNHEDDLAMAKLLDALSGTKASFVITARRCLLAGVLVYPVTAPLVTQGKSAFPRVAALTRTLRWNPLALDIADAIVRAEDAGVRSLAEHLEARGVGRVRAIDHEDDLPEVGALVGWAWARLSISSRRLLGVLAASDGDHMDVESLGILAKVRKKEVRAALEPLARWHLVQEPLPDRFALHAVVRHAVAKRTKLDRGKLGAHALEHYATLLERDPSRLGKEQTHFFAAMDFAQRAGNMSAILRLDELSQRIEGPGAP